jgi:hypothetical protein
VEIVSIGRFASQHDKQSSSSDRWRDSNTKVNTSVLMNPNLYYNRRIDTTLPALPSCFPAVPRARPVPNHRNEEGTSAPFRYQISKLDDIEKRISVLSAVLQRPFMSWRLHRFPKCQHAT